MMKNIEIRITKSTRYVDIENEAQKAGNEGENLQTNLIFSFTDSFVEGQARLEYTIDGESRYVILDKIGETYQTPIKSEMTKKGTVDMQLVITEGIEKNEISKFKSNIFYLPYGNSINAEIEQPEEYEEWIDIANTKLNQVDNLDINLENNILTITKKDGTTKVENVKGDKGDKGDAGSVEFIVVNELPSENIDESAIYMIPSGETEGNTYQEYIYVNGTWESLGGASVEVDLTGYATEEYVDNTSAQVASVKLEPYYWNGQGSSSSNQTNVVLFQSIINNMKEGKKVCVITTNTNDFRTKNLENVILFPATGIDVSTYTGKLYFTSQGYNYLSVNTTGYYEVTLMMRRYSTYINMTEGVVTYVHKIDAYNNQVTADSGILAKNNKMQFIPTHDYNPATKKYVDDAIATLKAELGGQ